MIINSETLRIIRRERGLNQKDFAEFISVSFRTYQNYETGHPIPETKKELIAYKINAENDTKEDLNADFTHDIENDLKEYSEILEQYKVKNRKELNDLAFKYLANKEELNKLPMISGDEEMKHWIWYDSIIKEHGSMENYLNKEL